jgi:hypothetical protein
MTNPSNEMRRREFFRVAAGVSASAFCPRIALADPKDPPTDAGRLPKPYFLQEAVLRGFSAIAARLDRQQGCRPFFFIRLRPKVMLEHQTWDLGDMCGRYVDAFLLGRQMTGCSLYREEEPALRKLLHDAADPFAHPFMAGRMLLAFVDEYLESPSPDRHARVKGLVSRIKTKLTFEQDYAFWFKAPEGWHSMKQPIFGDFAPYPTYPLGGITLALSRFVEAVDFPEGEDLLDRLGKFILDKSGTFDESGRCQGHTHSGGILTAAVGLLRWAIHKGDAKTIERMKTAFDWCAAHSSSWGWVPDGLGQPDASCETCALTDAIHLGLLLARHVDPSYYDTVERYARNQLMENQFRKPELAVPPDDNPMREQAVRAVLGSWASYSLPNSLDNGLEGIEGCCLGSGIRGCFLAWEHAITRSGDSVMVNMGVSRNSPWVEAIAYEPYAGKMEIAVHDAPKLLVRIPAWAAVKDLKVFVGGNLVPAPMSKNRYLEFAGLPKGSILRIEYPLVSRRSSEKVRGQWYEAQWEGGTVVGVEPRGQRYPLFERGSMQQEDAKLQRSLFADQEGGPVHW